MDVALFCVLAGMEGDRVPKTLRIGAATLALVGILLTPAIGPAAGGRPPVLFFAKLGLLAYVLVAGGFLTSRTRTIGGRTARSTRTTSA